MEEDLTMVRRDAAVVVTTVIGLLILTSTALAGETRQEAGFEAVDAYIEQEMAAWRLPGVALAIVQDGEIVHEKGYGKAGPGDRPMTTQTPLFIGSTSKSFTALAIMQLAEEGRIDLDERAQTYLPWFRLADETAAANITVRELLNQDSGLSESSGRQQVGSRDRSEEAINNGVRMMADDALAHPVGEKFEYSNANYQVLGAIVQAASGWSYEDHVQEEIYDPLDMGNCYTSQDEALKNDLSTGYVRWWFNIDIPRTRVFNRGNLPSGMLMCDARGMAHYLMGYLNEGRFGDATILSAEGIAQMHEPAVQADRVVTQTEDDDSFYGMGWYVGTIHGRRVIHHGGDVANHQTALLMVPEEELGIALITNINHLSVSTITRVMAADVMNILHGEPTVGYAPNPGTRFIYLTLLGPLVLALVWAGWSIPRALRRRKKGSPPPRGFKSVLWVIVLPLILDGFFIIYYLVITPMLWNVPLKMYSLYWPDVWSVILLGALAGAAGIVVRLAAYLGSRRPAV
jgi:CubicO group peptidase (beta-lactamase class C family)